MLSCRSIVFAVGLTAFATFAIGCTVPRTQVAIRVATNMPQGPTEQLRAVQVSVFYPTNADAAVHSVAYRLLDPGAGSIALPRDLLVLYPGDNNRAETFLVQAMPLGAGDLPLFHSPVAAIANFEVGHSRELTLYLAAQCLDVTCPAGTTCNPDGMCVDAHLGPLPGLDASTLPDVPLPRDANLSDAYADVDAVDSSDVCSGCMPGATRSCNCDGTQRCGADCQWGACSSSGCPGGTRCQGGSCCSQSCTAITRCGYNDCGDLCDNCPSVGEFTGTPACTPVAGPGLATHCDPTTLACLCPSGHLPCCSGGCCP